MRPLQYSKSSDAADSSSAGDFLQQDDNDRPNSREVMCLVFPDGSVTTVNPQE
ncbi:MAG: hypothetical protein AAFQ63_03960 [Cyanobacteria bacterium J06621_11]